MVATVNILLTSISGLGLPSTLSVPLSADLPISAFTSLLQSRLPEFADNLVLTTTNGRRVDCTSSNTLATLQDVGSSLLPLRLSSVLFGGKGGFGSQLRAAGGRMSSRKNRNNNRDPNASSRNLDGRRLRTVTEAKALADYLASKPDMDKKEREDKRQRWESIVESAERKEEELRNGKKGARLDGEWVEKKEEEENKTREAVMAMMKAGLLQDDKTGSESEKAEENSDDMELERTASGSGPGSGSGTGDDNEEAGGRSFFGWDEEDMSEDDEDEDEGEDFESAQPVPAYEGKGKGKAV